MIAERTKLAAAKAKGRHGGRSRKEDQAEKALRMYETKQFSISEIVKTIGIGRRTFYDYLKKKEKA